MNDSYIITIGRQLGSGGKLIGQRLSGIFNIPCYDKELIHIASKESGIGRELFEQADESNSHSFLNAYFGFRSGFMGYNETNYLCNETLFKIQSDVIREIASKGSGIFVGRCADYILRDHPRCLRLFIAASMPDRISRLCHELGISEKEAQARIEQVDRKRAAYYNYYSNKEWGVARSYDICLNSSFFSLDEIIAIVEEQIRRKFK
jgi:cytidylate kinase